MYHDSSAGPTGRTPSLHRTPTHCDLLRAVSEGSIHYRPASSRPGSFITGSGLPFGPGISRAALHELHLAQLITVDRDAGAVTITAAGRHVLADWSTPAWLRPAS